MRFHRDILLFLTTGLVLVWCVVLPFFWARNIDQRYVHIGYWQMLSFYLPELIVGAVILFCLPFIFFRKRLAVFGLLTAAILVPTLKFCVGSPSYGTWVISFILLLVLSRIVHVRSSKHTLSTNANSDIR